MGSLCALGVIKLAIINAPGSWHDAKTARPLFERLENATPDPYYLITDTAFPRGTSSISGKIKAPLKTGEHVTADLVEQDRIMRFDRELLSFRQTAEWGMRSLQGSFARLRMPLDINNPNGRARLLETCARLHNIRTICVGVNQIRSVYMPTWQKADDERMWTNLHDMMFGDIRKFDRVARFHHLVVDE